MKSPVTEQLYAAGAKKFPSSNTGHARRIYIKRTAQLPAAIEGTQPASNKNAQERKE